VTEVLEALVVVFESAFTDGGGVHVDGMAMGRRSSRFKGEEVGLLMIACVSRRLINDFTELARDCQSFATEIGTAFSKNTVLPA